MTDILLPFMMLDQFMYIPLHSKMVLALSLIYFHSHLPFRFQLTFLNDHTLHLAIYPRAALLAAIFFSFLFTVF